MPAQEHRRQGERAGRGQGVATIAATMLADWAVQAGAPAVTLLTFPGNEASQAVADRAGFVRDGTLRRGVNGVEVDLLLWRRPI